MASTRSTLLCQVVLMPSALSVANPKCKCGKSLSINNKNAPPERKPTIAGTQGIEPFAVAISIEGLSSDQKLAAIITPAAKPNIEFKIRLSIVLKKNTMDAPKAVIDQVNRVAISAIITGLYSRSQSNFILLNLRC